MYMQLLASKRQFDNTQQSEAQRLLLLSSIIQQNSIPTVIPTNYNLKNSSESSSNYPEMIDGFRGRRKQQGESSEDMQHYPHVNADGHANHDDSPHGQRTDMLLAAPLGEIDDYDGDNMDLSSRYASKRAKFHDQHSGQQETPVHPTSSNTSSMPQDASSLTPPSPPYSAFVFFFRIQRENLLEKAKNGDTTFQNTQQVVQEIEKRWGLLAREESRLYEQLAANDQARYQREMEEYQQQQQQQQQQLNHQQQRLSNQGEQATGNRTQNMLHLDPRLQHQVNVIAALRPPFPNTSAPANAATNVATIHHHFMPPTQPMAAVAGSSNAIFPITNAITPPHNAGGGGAGQQILPIFSIPQHSPSNSVASAPPPALRATSNSGAIVLPPHRQSLPLPPGMEIELNGRKYRVTYQCQLMTREEAQKYVKPYTAAQSDKQPQGSPASSS